MSWTIYRELSILSFTSVLSSESFFYKLVPRISLPNAKPHSDYMASSLSFFLVRRLTARRSLARTYTTLTKSEEKERLLAV